MQLDRWRIENGLTFEALAARLSTEELPLSTERVRRYCLPHDHRLSTTPTRRILLQIFEKTDGFVQPNDFAGLVEDAPRR